MKNKHDQELWVVAFPNDNQQQEKSLIEAGVENFIEETLFKVHEIKHKIVVTTNGRTFPLKNCIIFYK